MPNAGPLSVNKNYKTLSAIKHFYCKDVNLQPQDRQIKPCDGQLYGYSSMRKLHDAAGISFCIR